MLPFGYSLSDTVPSRTNTAHGLEFRHVKELLFALAKNPSAETYLALREVVITGDFYQPYSDEFDTAGELFEQEKFEEARQALSNGMPNLIISPRAHQLIAYLHSKLGDDQGAQVELLLGRACLEGILQTGDGSEANPYLVTRTSDEHDLIHYLGKEVKQQSLLHQNGAHFDLIECTDGSSYWFDISTAYDQLSKSIDG